MCTTASLRGDSPSRRLPSSCADLQRHSATDVIVIYDATHGSLRLSESLYTKLDLLISRLRRAVDMIPKETDLVSEDLVEKLEHWHDSLGTALGTEPDRTLV